ncbi:MAG: type III-B CRISPR module RAMP protein Cmr6 [Pseudomonadota bacterium]|nr:type III-B CRISPR module RAMP protein Cmr6 [Pseudomonadota bacterium]
MTHLPLYPIESPPHLEADSHLGLWHTRFFNQYDTHWSLKEETAKNDWIKSVARRCGNEKALKQQAQRLLALAEKLNGEVIVCKTSWHFVTGMGLAHPVENGLAWHPTLGVPYLAGSGVKGLLRAWMECWGSSPPKQWFGLSKKEGDSKDSAGELIFFDAIPIEPVRLVADIMTPHYGKWYEQGHEITGATIADVLKQPERLPADWHNPIPVPFLAVREAKLLFIIAQRLSSPLDSKEVKAATEALKNALQFLGAGAKTAAGYGRMEVDEKALENLQTEHYNKQVEERKAKEMAQMSPFEQDIQIILNEGSGVGYLRLLTKLEEGFWQDEAEKKVVAEKIRDLMQQDKAWKTESKAKKPIKDKDYQRTLKVLKYL